MPRQSKSKTEVAETTTAVNTPVVEQVVEKVAKASSKQTKPKAPKTESVETVSAPVVAGPTDAPQTEAVDSEGDLAAQTTEFLAKLNQASTLFATLKTEFRALEKKWGRALKTAEKSQAKRKRKSGNRQPSGFVKPTKISDELAKFLEKPVGTEMARTDVTREITEYVRAHKLQDASNGRRILADDKLKKLLGLKDSDELTYFNLQKYMSHHFPKTEKAVATA